MSHLHHRVREITTITASCSRCSATASWPAPREALHSCARDWAVLHSEVAEPTTNSERRGSRAMRDTLFMGLPDVVGRVHRDSYGRGGGHHGRRDEVPDPPGALVCPQITEQTCAAGCKTLPTTDCTPMSTPDWPCRVSAIRDFGSRHPGSSYSHVLMGHLSATRGSRSALGAVCPQ